MNIYLDIDGVLLINEDFAAPHADEFIQRVLEKYPNSTYWLTTHCWQGENRTKAILANKLEKATEELLKLIQPTDWGECKTDAIDWNKPFLWFDDDLYEDERQVLEEHNCLSSWIEVDLVKDPEQLLKHLSLVN